MKITKLLEEIQDIPNPQKEFWVVENPRNGLQVHYTESYDEALDWVNKVDPDGMLDFNIRQLEGETPKDDLSPEQKANVFVREAKKDKEEKEEPTDEEPENEEPADEDVEFGDVENPEQTIQTNLQSALEAAKSLGDDILIQQIGNTITFFTRKFVVGLEDKNDKDAQIPSPPPEEPSELDEIYRNKMLRIAGILK
jgi:hypothetical protein